MYNIKNVPKSIFLGFDFYGSGNIGDDLMLDGFLRVISSLKNIKIFGFSNWNVKSQSLRFPSVNWINKNQNIIDFINDSEIECWAGVGDTPFQLTIGDWFKNYLNSQLETIKKFSQKIMINIGVENEICSNLNQFRNIVCSFEKISTRDQQSSVILSKIMDFSKQKLYSGADLANISLFYTLNGKNVEKKYETCLIICADTMTKDDIEIIKNYIINKKEKVAFVACETRESKIFEIGVYKNFSMFHFSEIYRKADLIVPHYSDGSIYDLIYPICANEIVISTRYHGLLIAAWAGCKVGAIARSSKVKTLANVLNVPCVDLPLTRKKMEYLESNASKVSQSLLFNLKQQAVDGVNYALQK